MAGGSSTGNRMIDLGHIQVDVASRVLHNNGRRVRLQEQPFKVLEFLLDRPGALVSRAELRQALWPNSVLVDFEHGLNNAIARLRSALDDDRANPRFIETVPRRGYRFVHPGAMPSTAQVIRAQPRPHDHDSIGIRRIAVLPFIHIPADQGSEHFGHGLVEVLVSRLASAHGLAVVARTSAYEFDGDRAAPAAIATALDVDHYVDGSVSRQDGGLHVAARLTDARAGRPTWSEGFTLRGDDALGAGEAIARAVAAALGATLDEHGAARPVHAEAHRRYRIAKAHIRAFARPPDRALAQRLLEQAIELDPSFADAHAALADLHFAAVMSAGADADAGERAAARAVALDVRSSYAWQQRANFGFVRARRSGNYTTYLAAQEDMQRAIALDPGNSLAFQDYGRALLWNDPDLAMQMLSRATDLELLCTYPKHLMAMLFGCRGELAAARSLCAEVREREPDELVFTMALGTLETYFGDFGRAVPLLRSVEPAVKGAARLQLWSIYLSLGDHDAAYRCLDFGNLPFEGPLSAAARCAMVDDHAGAFQVLEEGLRRMHPNQALAAPAAKFALISGRAEEALRVLSQRYPDLAAGLEPISARNVLPAIDLATARERAGQHDEALCTRIAAYLDGPRALRLPMLAFQRARLNALLNEVGAACDALDDAFEAGFRTLWALDLRPQSELFIDPILADPALDPLRTDPRFVRWRERVELANEQQRARLSEST